MKSKKLYVSLAVLTLILTAGIASVSAYQGDYSQPGPNCTPDRHEAMEEAFKNGDYNAWRELMAGKGRVSQIINEDNFSRFARAHELAEIGQTEEANAIRTELGLRTANGEGVGAGYRGGNGERKGAKNNQGINMRGNGNFGPIQQ